ncbi:MAG: type II toxin-antitoxin system RelE/ParE family toxin [Candidatus Micrarchaeota archaeon]|nr:type II toxin-antitoxin system RelE/ParE family toxin [Candidatus Micrarchaeota archaeon]
MQDARAKSVKFADLSLKEAFERLKNGRHEEKELYSQIDNAIRELEKNPAAGIKIPRRVWPRIYVQKYGITTLRKYDLWKGWRLIYTLRGSSIEVVAIVLEWLDHSAYERRFGYHER